jgi:hypothetical protein
VVTRRLILRDDLSCVSNSPFDSSSDTSQGFPLQNDQTVEYLFFIIVVRCFSDYSRVKSDLIVRNGFMLTVNPVMYHDLIRNFPPMMLLSTSCTASTKVQTMGLLGPIPCPEAGSSRRDCEPGLMQRSGLSACIAKNLENSTDWSCCRDLPLSKPKKHLPLPLVNHLARNLHNPVLLGNEIRCALRKYHLLILKSRVP